MQNTLTITPHKNGYVTVTDTTTGYSITAWEITYGKNKGRYDIRGPRERGYGAVLTATCAADRLESRCVRLFADWAATFAEEAKHKADNASHAAKVAATESLWRGAGVCPQHCGAGYARLAVDVPDAKAAAFVAACVELGISL